jgi:hypothetical protein
MDIWDNNKQTMNYFGNENQTQSFKPIFVGSIQRQKPMEHIFDVGEYMQKKIDPDTHKIYHIEFYHPQTKIQEVIIKNLNYKYPLTVFHYIGNLNGLDKIPSELLVYLIPKIKHIKEPIIEGKSK